MAISIRNKVIRSKDTIAGPVDNELIMADIDCGKYYGLNDITTAIRQNVETKITVEDLCKRLCESYEVTPEQCSMEVIAFLKELETRNLISVEG
jgi:hypothetical protein